MGSLEHAGLYLQQRVHECCNVCLQGAVTLPPTLKKTAQGYKQRLSIKK